ncbi:hypothetical protein NPS74_23025, partial [Cutibacterium acnes subsp. acnes]|nr:hypothetical protein [Cutibacterium acnes subsp. acnes]
TRRSTRRLRTRARVAGGRTRSHDRRVCELSPGILSRASSTVTQSTPSGPVALMTLSLPVRAARPGPRPPPTRTPS